MKMNSEDGIKDFLRKRAGYLKWSARKLADYFKWDIETTVKVLESLKDTPKLEKKKPLYVKRVQNKPVKKQLPRPYLKGDKHNVLVIADTHEPFSREGYLEFCRKIQEKYNCGRVVHIGDEVDNCAVSQYSKDPDGFSAGTEAAMALDGMQRWYEVFPEALVCIGNHSARMFRMAHEAGLPKRFLKSYEEIWNAPRGWKWSESWDIDGVHYTHGTGTSGPNAAMKIALQRRQSVVIGHIHSEATIQYNVSNVDRVFGMIVGSGVDDSAYAFNYAKDTIKKSVISCAVVLEGRLPIIELMEL